MLWNKKILQLNKNGSLRVSVGKLDVVLIVGVAENTKLLKLCQLFLNQSTPVDFWGNINNSLPETISQQKKTFEGVLHAFLTKKNIFI